MCMEEAMVEAVADMEVVTEVMEATEVMGAMEAQGEVVDFQVTYIDLNYNILRR